MEYSCLRCHVAIKARRDDLLTLSRCRCDVALQAETMPLLRSILQQQPITQVLHAGGVLHDAPLARQTPELLREVLAPKAYGAWNLAQHLPPLAAAQYLAFSSIAALTGPAGSMNYAGANACLDAQAAQLQAAGARQDSCSCCGAGPGCGQRWHRTRAGSALS